VIGLLLLGAIALVGDAYYQVKKAADPLETIRADLSQARGALAHGKVPRGDPFTAASQAAAKAQSQVDDTNFAFRLIGRIPVLNRPVHAVRLEAEAAGEWAAAAITARDMVLAMLGPKALRGQAQSEGPAPVFNNGSIDVKLIQTLPDRLGTLIHHLETGRAAIERIRPIPFYSRLTRSKERSLAEVDQNIALAQNGLQAARLLPAFLGADGPKTYFLALQNNSDLRATGGAVLAFAFVTIDRGKLSLTGGGPIADEEPRFGYQGVPLPAGVSWYLHNVPLQHPRIANLNWTPDFPTDAQAWASLLENGAGRPVDGAIALDPIGIAGLLGNRKIKVESYPDAITGENAVEVIENDQYRLDGPQRQAFPSELIDAAWPVLKNLHPLVKGLQQFGTALKEKHIQMWSSNAEQEALLAKLGWDGGIRVGKGDYLQVVDNKLRVDKVDYYTHTAITYDVQIGGSGGMTSTAKVALTNMTPPGQPHAIAGPPDHPYGLNAVLLGLYVPKGVTLISETPQTGYPVHIEGDTKVFTRRFAVLAGKTGTGVFSYSMPGVIRSTAGSRLYELTVQHQPLVNPATLTVTVTLPAGTTVKSAPGWTVKGNVATYQGVLTQDLHLSIVY